MKNKSLILLILSVFLLVLTSCDSNEAAESVIVFSGGKTDYAIITPDGASEEVLALANELADLSGTGEVRTDASAETELEILVGDTNRAATMDAVKKLQEASTVSALHYIIAEQDGKLVIISDSDIGYIYALDYIKATYIADASLTIPRKTYDFKQVLWDDYYASELYFDRLTAEADKNRYDSEKDQLENEMNRYEENKGNNILTVEQAIEQYKNKVASFNTADFGEYTPATFISANVYREPTVYPGNSHPRVYFTDKSIDSVRESLNASESVYAYRKYIALSDAPCDGKFKSVSGNMTHNYDSGVPAQIEAKAFRYAMTGEEIYGYEAIYAAKNAMLTIDVPHTVGDWCRTYGYLMSVVAYVYDWCYDLMTPEDMAQIIAGGVNLLGMHFEIVCYNGATNKVPNAQGTMYGHGAEDQLLVDYLSFAIATYNEAPEIYDFVAGRILNDYVEGQNFLFQSGSHWEGSMYGPVRTAATIVSNILFNRMTDGTVTPFENVKEAIITATYYERPDGQVFRIGDLNENHVAYKFAWLGPITFFAGNLYGDSYLKSYSYEKTNSFKNFTNAVAALSPIQFLAINNPDISHSYAGTMPLTRTTSYPNTNIFARSANDDKNAFAIYMTMPENYASSHAHMECGSFQIFYKGALASDSGVYSSWGGAHHMGYNMQTISSNSLLIYNPDLADRLNTARPNMVYSGGQSIDNGANLPETLEQLMNHPAMGQCTSLGVANVEEGGRYLYSYMGGDMTNAYDEETVSEVCRYMFAVATGNNECPLVFMTFDSITSLDAAYKKTALIHVQEEPTITKDGYAIITNTKGDNNGKMVVQSVGYGTDYTVIGGEGKQYWVVDKNIPANETLIEGSIAEYGWGRIEISPSEAEKTNHMLTVMYVTDADNKKAPVKAENITSDNLTGAMIFGKAVLFSENEKLLTEESSFTLTESADCYIAGVEEGSWNIMKDGSIIDTVTVDDTTHIITFTASGAGEYTIQPVK